MSNKEQQQIKGKKENIIYAFKIFEKEDGIITCKEFRRIMIELGQKFEKKDIDEMIKEGIERKAIDGENINYYKLTEIMMSK